MLAENYFTCQAIGRRRRVVRRRRLFERLVTVSGRYQVGDEIRRVRRTEAGNRIPTRRGRVTRAAGVSLVLATRDVVEIRCVALRIGADCIECGVDQAQATSVELGRNGHQPGPLWSRQRSTADVKPTRAAGYAAAEQATAAG